MQQSTYQEKQSIIYVLYKNLTIAKRLSLSYGYCKHVHTSIVQKTVAAVSFPEKCEISI